MTIATAWDRVSPERRRAIGRALARVEAKCDREARMSADPIGPVRRYSRPQDLEIAALIGACLAFGNVKALRAKVEQAFERLGADLAVVSRRPEVVRARLAGFRHRVYRAEDLAGLVIGAGRVQEEHGGLGRLFERELAARGTLREALAAWTRAIRSAGGLEGGRRGAAHILPDPTKASACKRLLLYLRWMVRPADGVDLGLWSFVSPSILLVPLDTHIHKLSRNLGFTNRSAASWQTAEEITRALRTFDATDPARFDFSLCHLGMLQRCPSRRDPARCEGCGVQSVCRHWAKSGAPRRVARRSFAGTPNAVRRAPSSSRSQ